MHSTFLVASAALSLLPAAHAQETYRLPPQEVVDIVDADPAPSVQLSPDGAWMFLVEYDAMPSIEDVSRRMLRLAGTRIDPVANSRFSTRYATGVKLRPTFGAGEPTALPLPDGAKISSVSWSPTSEYFVVTVATPNGSSLYGGNVNDVASMRLLTDRLNTVTGGPSWVGNSGRVLCRLVPEDRGVEPAAPTVPKGPNIQSTSGEESPLRTYQDLLSNPYDEALFEYYATTELALIDIDRKDAAPQVLGSGIYTSARLSPNGEYLLETKVQRPFSYLMPYSRFPQVVTVRNVSSDDAVTIAELALGENIPIGGVPTGPRGFTWRANEPETLLWTEALDGGDPKTEVPHRDRWLALVAPFDVDSAQELVRVEHRAAGMTFFADGNLVVTGEYDRDRRWTRSLLHDLTGDQDPLVLEDRSSNDRYGNPGRLAYEPGPYGYSVIRREGNSVYRTGAGATPEGALPFLRRQDLTSLEFEELWRCEPGSYESIARILPSGEGTLRFITSHESPDSPPNYRARELGSDEVVALTDFADPTPQLRGIKKTLVQYERSDGVPLSATLYLPADYEEGTRLPLVVWAYPREFNDVGTAGQVSGTPSRFTRIRGSSHLFYLTQGYAIMDGATIPIIGDAETMNDTFRTQLVDSAQAAIDYAVEAGVADGNRVGVGGHSYGAFMTANLLAHSDIFHAGVARSGAYNRTLTPFGFQSERRTFWQSPETYFAISPFMHADKIKEPMLMIHGEADNNSGTFPMQSRRMYQAIKGNGGTARLVMLPNESHGYRARESVLHCLAEMIDWFDIHVKNAGKPVEASFPSGGK